MLWCLSALLRFFLERMDHPNVLADLHGVDHPLRITPKWQGNLEHARSHAVHGLSNVGLAALCRDRQGGKTNRPRPFRKRLEFLPCRSDP